MSDAATALETILAYHERTKHRLDRYAAGPEALDWDAQPNPFREFAGAPRMQLPLAADTLATGFAALHQAGAIAPQPLDIASVGILLELSMAISAWKEYGPDRWALRCNPSSGNLHPTEAYVLSRNVAGLADGVHHYLSLDHSLELRCRHAAAAEAPASLHVGLSSVSWREAWKYGERAFRYCQHDAGHALGALRYAAAALGWTACLHDGLASEELSRLLGVDRQDDYADAEPEEAELLLGIGPDSAATLPSFAALEWLGRANRLDPRPMYRWPAIDEVAAASRKPVTAAAPWTPARPLPPLPPLTRVDDVPAATLFRQRRSAQHFDSKRELDAACFYRMLDATLPRDAAPWDVWAVEPRLHLVLFVHRVTGIAPGIYALPRTAAAHERLRQAMHPDFAWTKPAGCPAHLPLHCLIETQVAKIARTVSCHQAIAADGAFSLAMLAEFEQPLAAAPWRYRRLFWEAGLIGQVLYLEAEAAGVRGTGIGCYFDDVCHELCGLEGKTFQSLYHFTVGAPLVDERIASRPPYPARTHLE
jgi:SagB-type dehydrogenase family enzyme